MANYLDLHGLGTFWNNTKTYIDALKFRSAGSFSEDSIENRTIGADANAVQIVSLYSFTDLTVVANPGTPNFVLEIDNTANPNDVKIKVTSANGAYDLVHSTAATDTIPAGKYVQLIAVGNCWTWAEFGDLSFVPESRDIWIQFKFDDKTYNPKAHQLAVGQAITGADKYGEGSKSFAADWQLVDPFENIWMWGVISGTKLSNAFVYGDGDGDGVGIPLLSDDTIISGIPEEVCILEGYPLKDRQDEADSWRGTLAIAPEDYVKGVHIHSWNLKNATMIDNLFGTNVWYNNTLYGAIPSLLSDKINNISYAFDRLFHITSFGEMVLPNCEGLMNSFMTCTSLQALPSVICKKGAMVNNMFAGCCNASTPSINDSYTLLVAQTPTGTANAFKAAGAAIDTDSLAFVQKSWAEDSPAPIIDTVMQTLMEKYGKTVDDVIDFGWMADDEKGTITVLDLNAFPNFTSINANDFWYDSDDLQYFSSLKWIDFGAVKIIDGGSLLRNCTSLEYIVGKNITAINASSFIKGATSLRAIALPNLKIAAGFAFAMNKTSGSGSPDLKILILDSLETTGQYCFGAYNGAENYFEKISLKGLTSLAPGTFRGCSYLTDLYLPETPPNFPSGVNDMFANVTGTINVHVKSEIGVTNYQNDSSWATISNVTLNYLPDWL